MRFSKATPDEPHDLLRFESESGLWSLGLHRVLFGVRVVASRRGEMSYAINYCAGASPLDQIRLFTAVKTIMERWPEDITSGEVERQMPDFTIKPIFNDPTCWRELQVMAYGQKEVQV